MLKTFFSFFLVIALILLGNIFTVKTQALSYSVQQEFEINLLENNTGKVKQMVTVVNNSPDFLSTSMSLDFPFQKVESLKVVSEGEGLPASIENNRLWINFETEELDYNETKVFEIYYDIKSLTKTYGEIRAITWPEFRVEGEKNKYLLKLIHPTNWGDILYSSKGINQSVAFDTRQVTVFNDVQSPISIYFGNHNIKQFDLILDENNMPSGLGPLILPVNRNFQISGLSEVTRTELVDNEQSLIIDVNQYTNGKPVRIIQSKPDSYIENTKPSKYAAGIEDLVGIETDDTMKLYNILLTKLKANKTITEWKRNDITEIMRLRSHTDLDYATMYSEVFKSKGLSTNILYGLVEMPNGEFHWHFWLAYKSDDGWKQIDPYLESLEGYNGYAAVPPIRVVWGVLDDESDLSDLNPDLFSVNVKNIQLKYFTNPSALAGYITSQLNENTNHNSESVLGAATFMQNQEPSLNKSVVFVIAGFCLLLISFSILRFEMNYKRK